MTFTVLVVDDDFRVAHMHAAQVDAADGFEVGAVVHTAEAAAKKQGNFDLALVDVYLPDGSGIDVVRGMSCDALMLSAAGEAETVRAALAAGALGYLLKPFTPSDLSGRLESYVRYRRALKRSAVLDQSGIDDAISALHRAPGRGNASVTRDLVLVEITGAQKPLSAAEVAELVGISRATAQRYLAALVSTKTVRMRMRYGTTGRPEQEYEL